MMRILKVQREIACLVNKFSTIIPRYEIEALLAYLFNCDRNLLYVKDIIVDEIAESLFESMVQRRLSGEPLQYITGQVRFMGLGFLVNKAVFIPRPETEILVNEALSAVSCQLTAKGTFKILDLCTGCGNIAVSLIKPAPRLEIVATDISERALEIAEKNAVHHGAGQRITFYKGDLFRALPVDKNFKFDIIICNPPYVKTGELSGLQKEVRCEPGIALDGGIDGLDFYRGLAEMSPGYLKKKGRVFLEVGFGQAHEVIDIFSAKKMFNIDKIEKDLSGIERVIWISLS